MRFALLALLLAGLAAAPAQAGSRADAKRLVRIFMEHERAVDRVGERWEAEFEAQTEACAAKPPDSVPAMMRGLSLYIRGVVMRADAEFARVERRLRRFRTDDRRLRRVARAMARSSERFRVLGESPPEPCPYLEAWRAAGWAADFRISPPARNFTEAELAAIRRDKRIVRRALPYLRRLGVGPTGLYAIRLNFSGDDIVENLSL